MVIRWYVNQVTHLHEAVHPLPSRPNLLHGTFVKREMTSNETRTVSSVIIWSEMKAANLVEFFMNDDVFPTSGDILSGLYKCQIGRQWHNHVT